MDMDLSDLPEEVRVLLFDLQREGFAMVSRRGSTVDGLIEIQNGHCAVRVSVDRGQWSLELGGHAVGGWYDPNLWQACLDDVPVSREVPDLDFQIAFIRLRWHEVSEALRRRGFLAGERQRLG